VTPPDIDETPLRAEDLEDARRRALSQDRALIAVALATSVAFIYVLQPFLSPVLWGFGLAVVFHPVFEQVMARAHLGRGVASLATVAIILFLIVLPVIGIAVTMTKEAQPLIEEFRTGAPNVLRWLTTTLRDLPGWAQSILNTFGIVDLEGVRERLTELVTPNTLWLATGAVTLSQSVLNVFVVALLALYLTFFFLRDAGWLWERIERALPLRRHDARTLRDDFVSVTRATIRGGVAVAVLEGLIGGLGFWAAGLPSPVLWGSMMAATSFVPIVGTALVWAPAAIYLALAGKIAAMIFVLAAGGVIVLCDNFVRPLVVGKGAGIPDYLVLFSTLGGIAAFGFNGIIVGPMAAAMFVSAWKATAERGIGRGGPC
jgi:predicted PurR-regulated permease PerM